MASKSILINYLAPVEVQSGLGSAARSYYKAMLSEDLNVNCIPLNYGHEIHPRIIAGPIKNQICTSRDQAILLILQNADGFEVIDNNHIPEYCKTSYKKIALWVWELENFPEKWKSCADSLTEIWTPSSFVQASVSKAVSCPVRVVPYPVLDIPIQSINLKNELNIQNCFLFGCVFDASSYVERKNPTALLKAFQVVRKNNPRIRLLLKVTHTALFERYLIENNISIEGELFLGVHLYERALSENEMRGLLSEIDCIVSPHRSEGFGFTIAESLLLAKPVIATNYGGSVDFLNPLCGFPIHYKLTQIQETLGPYEIGSLWAEIDQIELVEKMKFVLNNTQIAKKMAIIGRKFILDHYSPEVIGRLMKSLIIS